MTRFGFHALSSIGLTIEDGLAEFQPANNAIIERFAIEQLLGWRAFQSRKATNSGYTYDCEAKETDDKHNNVIDI